MTILIGWSLCVAQEAGGFLGRRGIDVEAGAPLESRDLAEFRHHLDVPVVMVIDLFSERRSVDDKIIRRTGKGEIEPL